jgi:hypothetical protein
VEYSEGYRKKPGFWAPVRKSCLGKSLSLCQCFGCTPTKKPGFLLNLWSTAKDIAKNPVSGHLCVSLVWENHCHCVNAFCRDKSAEIVWFIYGGVGADLGWVPP